MSLFAHLSTAQLLLLAIYVLVSGGLALYGAHCYVLLVLFLRRQRRARAATAQTVAEWTATHHETDWPPVTVQLPVYNEVSVIERLLRAAANLDYPPERLLIQVLDDSTDETSQIIDRLVAELGTDGPRFEIRRRADRRHYKAGALAEGLRGTADGFVALFDADFVPPREFLRRTVPQLLADPGLACVQGRWEHLNRRENWLTRAQSVGIDGHFTAEQGARAWNGCCLNFNGSGGLWRTAAIHDAGGWQGDTLTEDLDLSYRAQLRGWRLAYDFDLACPAEIPASVAALKSQQRRWAKGSIECARKLLPRVWASARLGFAQKLEATIHLTQYLVSVLMAALALLTLPLLLALPFPRFHWAVALLWGAVLVSALAPGVMYTLGGAVLGRGRFALANFPGMLVVGAGLCLNNAVAVAEGLLGRPSAFVRTPKAGDRRRSVYRPDRNLALAAAELLLGAYCLLTLGTYWEGAQLLFAGFTVAYVLGFTSFGVLTFTERYG